MNPIKFLDAYEKNDLQIFFGRDKEISGLYERVERSNLTLLYGLSGTGKTSLVKCGLANKYSDYDWYEIYLRRGDNFLQSLNKQLNKALQISLFSNRSLVDKLEDLYLEQFKTIYILFDQFEELFISGDRREVSDIIDFLNQIIYIRSMNVKVILIMREEFVANLDLFEKKIPDIFQNRLRLERMTRLTVEEVISKMLKEGKITINDEEIIQRIIYNISDESKKIDLPYLQVYMDRLYKTASKSDQGIVFSNTTLDQMGSLEDVLGDFLEEQIIEISSDDKERKWVWDLLKKLITQDGTKKVVKIEELLTTKKRISVEKYLIALEQRRIITAHGELYELKHDSLAEKIKEKLTITERVILEHQRIIREKSDYSDDIKKDYLTKEQVLHMLPLMGQMKLNNKETRFFFESKKNYEDREKRDKLTRLGIRSLIGLVLLIMIFTLTYIMDSNGNLKIKNEELESKNEELIKAKNSLSENEQTLKIKNENLYLTQLSLNKAIDSLKTTQVTLEQTVGKLESTNNKLIYTNKELDSAKRSAETNEEIARESAFSADSSAAVADTLMNRSLSKTLALSSIIEDNPDKKKGLADSAYQLNQRFNGGKWEPELTQSVIEAFGGVRNTIVYSPQDHVDPIVYIGKYNQKSILVVTNFKGFLFDIDSFMISRELWDNLAEDKEIRLVHTFDHKNRKIGKLISPQKIKKNKISYTYNLRDNDQVTYLLEIKPDTIALHNDNNKHQLRDQEIIDWDIRDEKKLILLDRQVQLYQHDEIKYSKNFGEDEYPVTCSLSETGRYIGVGTSDGSIYVIDLDSNINEGEDEKTIYTLKHETGSRISCIAFNEQDGFVLTGAYDGIVKLIDINNLEKNKPMEVQFESWIKSLVFVSDYGFIVGTQAGTLSHFLYQKEGLNRLIK